MHTEPAVIVALVVAALAVWEIIEIWHHSALFAPMRAIVETWDCKIGDLLRCPFCLAPWVSLAVVLLLLGLSEYLDAHGPRPLAFLVKAPFYAFAVARLANLGNDLSSAYCRTPRYDKLPDLEHAPDAEPGQVKSDGT